MDAKIQPLVSFIITAYNIPVVMLRECLESITSLSLSVSEREIIVIDDGSDFSPVNELMEMAPDIIFIRQPNRGVSVARNMGMKIATGKFIQFVDGDDCLINAPYEHSPRHRALSGAGRHGDVPFLTSRRLSLPISPSRDLLPGRNIWRQRTSEPLCVAISSAETGWMACALHRVLCTERMRNLRQCLVLKMHNVYSTEAKAYYYRKREGSVTHTESKEAKKKHIEDMLKVILNLKAIADRCDPLKKVSMDRRVAQLSMDFLINVIRLTKSRSQLTKAIDLLKQHGLYPSPDENYTKEYTIFRYMIQKKAGQLILIAAL